MFSYQLLLIFVLLSEITLIRWNTVFEMIYGTSVPDTIGIQLNTAELYLTTLLIYEIQVVFIIYTYVTITYESFIPSL